jgi:hypothetical protein
VKGTRSKEKGKSTDGQRKRITWYQKRPRSGFALQRPRDGTALVDQDEVVFLKNGPEQPDRVFDIVRSRFARPTLEDEAHP